MRIWLKMTKAHWLGIALGVVMGVVVLNVLLPRLPVWLGLVKKKPPVPFVISGDL
jgi:hypothetical protein